MQEQQTQTRYFPYVGAPGWLTKLHGLCIRSLPQRIEAEWLMAPERLGVSKSNAQQILSMLEKIGWVNNTGAVTDQGRRLRLDGEPWRDAVRESIRALYPDLLEQIESAADFTPEDVEKFFISASDIGRSGRAQMISIFRWFLREAELSGLEQKVWKSSGRASAQPSSGDRERQPRRKARAGTAARQSATPAARSKTPVDRSTDDPRLTTISSVLRIRIDGTWEEPRILAVLRMLDGLIKGERLDA